MNFKVGDRVKSSHPAFRTQIGTISRISSGGGAFPYFVDFEFTKEFPSPLREISLFEPFEEPVDECAAFFS